jgi:hypothetical protein
LTMLHMPSAEITPSNPGIIVEEMPLFVTE